MAAGLDPGLDPGKEDSALQQDIQSPELWAPAIQDGERPLYEAIAVALSRDIATGVLTPGDRLPTHRELATRLGAARSTIRRAYAEAERRGLIASTVGRGTFVAQTSGTTEFVDDLGRTRGGAIDMSFNDPLHPLDPDLAAGLSELSKQPGLQRLLTYVHSSGLPEHRSAGVEWLAQHGLPTTRDRVVVCAGAQHALAVTLMALGKPGDTLLVDRLTYPGIKAIAEALSLRLHGLEMDAEGMLPDALDSAAMRRTACAVYCLPTLQNPTSAVMGERRRADIAEVARRHSLPIIEDDVLRLYAGNVPPPITTMAPELGFFVATLSKPVAAGLRVAYVAVPESAVRSVSRAVWSSTLAVAPVLAELGSMWIRTGVAGRTIAAKRAEAAARQNILSEALAGFDLVTHPSSLYGWLRLPAPWTTADFVSTLRRQGVDLIGSDAFHVGTDPPSAVRICIGAPGTREELARGLDVVRQVLSSQPSPSVEVL
jgi:DNA-binding transcriptional MocR family regulator